MNKISYTLLAKYNVNLSKIKLIPHGTHLIKINPSQKYHIKSKYNYQQKIVLSTFGLLSPNKNIDIGLEAISIIKKEYPNIVYLVIGQTHPTYLLNFGNEYRKELEVKVKTLKLSDNVIFIDKYLPIEDLLEYLQMTDIYIFTSNDALQTVSGTLLYALSCGCPIITTKIPCSIDLMENYPDVSFKSDDSSELASCIKTLHLNNQLREEMTRKGLEITNETSWGNIAKKYQAIFESINLKL